MKPTPELVEQWRIDALNLHSSEMGISDYYAKLCELAAAWGAKQAQQTTEPLGFQIRRAIAAEDELRATKQTLEHAYAALQKVADAQAAIEEPEAVAWQGRWLDQSDDAEGWSEWRAIDTIGLPRWQKRVTNKPGCYEIRALFTATQMHAHFQAGVRAGMAQQSQDAKLEPLVREALRKAFSFGQRYWQQADSEYESHHKKSEETQRKFLALIEETIAAMQGGKK